MKNTKLTLAALAIVAGAFTSCKKKKAEAPAAPASTVQSFTYGTNNFAWTQNGNVFSAVLTVDAITTDILSKGTVNVFIGDGTGYNWMSMPVTLNGIQWRDNIYIHTVQVNAEESKTGNTSFANPGVQQFKVVVVSSSARIAHPDVDLNNYKEIKEAFHLAD